MNMAARVVLVALVAFAGVVAAHEHHGEGEHGHHGEHGEHEHEHGEGHHKEEKRVFAVFGDWGRLGGEGASAFPATRYNPNDPQKCPSNLQDPFYISIDPTIDPSGGPFDKKPNDPCVVAACGKLDGDQRENCEGKIQQLQAAYVLEKSCEHKGCEFVINTSDNFYALGCNSTDNSAGGSCAKRFQSDWIDVYKTKHQPALKPLTWYGSLGNHDVLGGIQGVDDQIAYTKENPEWYLPARYFATRIGAGKTAINLVVADTSSFIDGYLAPSSDYSKIDEEQFQSTAAQRAKQLAFLERALKAASKKSGWTIVVGHHPGFSGDQSYFRDDDTGKPESAAWGTFAALVKKYQPHFYVNGHDHVMCYFNAKMYGYSTQFFTSGAGSFTEPNDGGWNKTSGNVRTNKPYMKYSNVRMSDGASFTGNMVATATAHTLKAELFSAPTGTKAAFGVECTKGRRHRGGFKCTYGPGPGKPAYTHA